VLRYVVIALPVCRVTSSVEEVEDFYIEKKTLEYFEQSAVSLPFPN